MALLSSKRSENLIAELANNKPATPMVWSDWWNYRTNMVSNDRDDFGVYELADDNETTLYVGSGRVQTRLMEHLVKNDCPLATRYRIDCCAAEEESRTKEKQLLDAYKAVRNGKLPLYNEKTV